MLASLSVLPMGRLFRSIGGVLLLAMLIASVLTSPTTQAAGGTATFSLRPTVYDPRHPITQSYYILSLRPGATMTLGVRVSNTGTAVGSVDLYPTDAATGQTGGTVFRVRNDPRTDVGAWVSLQTQHLTLAPAQSQVVAFRLAIPRVVRPGQHVGGIVAEDTSVQSATSQNQRFEVRVEHLAIMAVQVTLPGPSIEQVTATAIQVGGVNSSQKLQVQLHNTGTVMVSGSGSLRLSDSQGHLLQDLALTLDTFLPATSIDYPLNVQHQALGPGDYAATFDLTYGHHHTLHYTTQVSITAQQVQQTFQPNGPLQAPAGTTLDVTPSPWPLVLVGLLLLSGLGYLGWRCSRLLALASRRKSRSQKRKRHARLPAKEQKGKRAAA